MAMSLTDIEAIQAAKGVDMDNLPPLTFENVLDVIWDADINRCSVSDRDETGAWRDANADILLDKQNKAKGAADSLEDSAPRPLFHTVSQKALAKPTYWTFIELLDNYDAVVNNIEYLNNGELDEISDFLDAILETDCMKICYKYVTEVLGFNIPDMKVFKRELFSMWFEIHNLRVEAVLPPSELEEKREALRLQNKGLEGGGEVELPESETTKEVLVKYCSGFEHVFMGEIQIPEGETIGNVIGYHNWIKFYMDEMTGLIDFLGTKYTKPSLSKIGAPFVCVKFRWDQDGQVYIKERGSFFVGCSPEFSMAVATVCFYETMNDELAQRCDWECRVPTKYKCKREIGGYKYEYYICRQSKYLVSCFQELTGITEETEAKLRELQRQRDAKIFEEKMKAKAAKIQQQAAAEMGFTLPDGTTLSRKAYNRLKRRLAEQAEQEGISVDDLIRSGRVPLPNPNQDDNNDKPKDKDREKKDKDNKQTDANANASADGKETAAKADKNKDKPAKQQQQQKQKPKPTTSTDKPATAAGGGDAAKDTDNASTSTTESTISIIVDEVPAGTTSTTGSSSESSSPAMSGLIDTASMQELSLDEIDTVPLTFPSIVAMNGTLSIDEPGSRGISAANTPNMTPLSKPVVVKPKTLESNNKCKSFQAFAKTHMATCKENKPDIADREAFLAAQQVWKELGNEIKKGMGMPLIKKRNAAQAGNGSTSTPVTPVAPTTLESTN